MFSFCEPDIILLFALGKTKTKKSISSLEPRGLFFKGKGAHEPKAHTTGAYTGFSNMKHA